MTQDNQKKSPYGFPKYLSAILPGMKSLFSRFTSSLDRTVMILVHDLFVASVSIPVSLWIWVGDRFPEWSFPFILKHSFVYMLLAASVFLWTQLYRGVWRYVSVNELVAIVLSNTGVSILYLPLMFLMSRDHVMPRPIAGIALLVSTGLMGFSRFAWRFFHTCRERKDDTVFSSIPQSRVLLIGSSSLVAMFIRDTRNNPTPLYEIVGIVEQRKKLVGKYVEGIEILGVLDDLPDIITQLNVEGRHPHHIAIADGDFPDQKRMRDLLMVTSHFKVDLAKLPKAENFKNPGPHGMEIKALQIEDILGYRHIGLDRNAIAQTIRGKRVLITGAGGSIGSGLARLIAALAPESIILLDHCESMLYSIDMELGEKYPDVPRTAILANVADNHIIDDIMHDGMPDIVFHAAALTHVPVAEQNPCQTILTNIAGTRNVAESCSKHGVGAMILISTDKAVSPLSIMGATRKVAENLCQVMDSITRRKKGTRFITVRCGDILDTGSSVVGLFRRQLASGGPLTVTHPEARRYFINSRDAVELLMEALVLGMRSSETAGCVFVLDTGEPIRIQDIATQMIQLSGLKPSQDVQIRFTGLRPCEKLIEERFLANEKVLPTSCEGLVMAVSDLPDQAQVASGIDRLESFALARQDNRCLELLQNLVPEYVPLIPGLSAGKRKQP